MKMMKKKKTQKTVKSHLLFALVVLTEYRKSQNDNYGFPERAAILRNFERDRLFK